MILRGAKNKKQKKKIRYVKLIIIDSEKSLIFHQVI